MTLVSGGALPADGPAPSSADSSSGVGCIGSDAAQAQGEQGEQRPGAFARGKGPQQRWELLNISSTDILPRQKPSDSKKMQMRRGVIDRQGVRGRA